MKNLILPLLFILVFLLSNCHKKSNNSSNPSTSGATSPTTGSVTSTTTGGTTGGTVTPTTADLTFIVKYKCPGTSTLLPASAKVVKIYDGLTNYNNNNAYYYQTTSGIGITTFTGLPLKNFYYSVGWSGSCGGVGSYGFSKTGNINLTSGIGYTVTLNVI